MKNFWNILPRAQCLPDNCSCEFIQTEALIAQPINFLTSGFYLFFAWWLYRQVPEKTYTLKAWIAAMSLVAFCSMFLHGSFTELGMALDFAGIVVLISFFIALKLCRKISRSGPVIFLMFFIYFFALSWMFYAVSNKWARVAMCVVIFSFALAEIIKITGKSFFNTKSLHYSLLAITFAFIFFILDELHIGCNPYNIIQGHGIWHFGTALSVYFYGKWRFLESKEKDSYF